MIRLFPIGVNFLQDNRVDEFLAQRRFVDSNAAGATVIEKPHFARALKAASPNAVIALRRYFNPGVNGDGGIEAITVSQYINWRIQQGDKQGGLHWHLHNEGTINPQVVRWNLDFLKQADPLGIDAVLGNPSVGRFNVAHYGNDEYSMLKDVFQLMDDINRRAGRPRMIWGLHEYSDGLDFRASYAHFVGRFEFLLELFQEWRINHVPLMFTEWGQDDADMKGGGRGWKQLGISAEQYADFLIRMYEDIYKSHLDKIISLNVFGYGDSGGWSDFTIQSAQKRSLLQRIFDWLFPKSPPKVHIVPNAETHTVADESGYWRRMIDYSRSGAWQFQQAPAPTPDPAPAPTPTPDPTPVPAPTPDPAFAQQIEALWIALNQLKREHVEWNSRLAELTVGLGNEIEIRQGLVDTILHYLEDVDQS